MHRRCWVILTIIIMTGGCITAQPVPKFQFAAGTRVGIINHLESNATHQNYQPIRVGNFTKKVSVDWNLPVYVEGQITRMLKNDPRYAVISLKLQEPFSALKRFTGPLTTASILDQETKPGKIKAELASHLDGIAGKDDLDVIIWIRSYKGPSPFKISKHPIELQGYGLFSRELAMSSKAYAYANIDVIVLKTLPATYIGSGTPEIDSSPQKDFELSGDKKNIAQSEFNKLKPIIQKYADEAVTKALQDANLIEPP